jgi:hypothetical protein
VAASYSVASRAFSSQPIDHDQYHSGFGSTQRTSQFVVNQALVGGTPRVRCLLLKLKPNLLRSPRWSSYRRVGNWELILSPDPKGKFILQL